MQMAGPETVIRENESQEELWNAKVNAKEQNALNIIKTEAENAGIKYESQTTTSGKMNDIIKKHFSFYGRSFNSEKSAFEETENVANRTTIDWVDQKYLNDDQTLKNVDTKFVEANTGVINATQYNSETGVKKDDVKISDLTKWATKKLETKWLQVIRDGKKIAVTDADNFVFKKWDLLWYTTTEKRLSDVMKYTDKQPIKFDILRWGKVLSVMKSEADPKKFVYVSEPDKEVFLQKDDKLLKSTDQRENVNNDMKMFYQGVMKDLRSEYESMSYEKAGEEKINAVLDLMVFYVNMFESDDAWVRDLTATVQQKEEAVKKVMREMWEVKGKVWEDITSKVRNDAEMKKNGYTYKETKYTTEKWAETPTEGFYRLPMAEVGKEALDANFKALKDVLDQPGVVILWYDVVGYASTVPYDGTQTITLPSGGIFDIKQDANWSSNSTLSQWRMKLAEDRLKTSYKDKFETGYTSKTDFKIDAGKDKWVDYNDPAHPEYKEWSNTPEGREKLNAIFGPYQGVDIKVNYRIDKQVPQYIYEKEALPKGPESYNYSPKSEVLVDLWDGSKPHQFEVSGMKLNQDNPSVTWGDVNEATTRKMKFDDMRVDGTAKGWGWTNPTDADKKCVVTNKFQEYQAYSQEDPVTYPPISDPKTNTSWIDKVQWTNQVTYGKGEVVRKTPIFNLDIKNNAVHQKIYEDMQALWFGTEKGVRTDITDKQLAEYMDKRTKQYVKDGISNRARK